MRVLVVDDDQTTLNIVAAVARRAGAGETCCFSTPLAALAWLEQHTPDMILLDQLMPEVDGLELLRRIRRQPRLDDVPVVMITANDDDRLKVTALESGASDFLTKPLRVTELRARIRNLLSLRRSQVLLKDQAALLAHEVARATADIRQREVELVNRLSTAAEFRDPETGAHIERMARYSAVIARRLGLEESFCQTLQLAAPMHDIGKVGVPDAILLKPARLTPEEMVIMRQHPEIGYTILKDSHSALIQLGAEIARSHHEKWDGSGYPFGLAGTAIPLAGRIVALADVYDALTSARPYKAPWTAEDALALIREQAGRHFDPQCLAAFIAALEQIRQIQATFQDPQPPAPPPFD